MPPHRVVIKFGTNVLTGGGPSPVRERLVPFAQEIRSLNTIGHEIIVCSSGAVAAGKAILRARRPVGEPGKRAYAALGQAAVMSMWQDVLRFEGIPSAQLLMNGDGIKRRSGFLGTKETINDLLAHGVVPVINENDAAATAECQIGNNDRLAAAVALLANASLLLILTDREGVFTRDPRLHPDALPIARVDPLGSELNDVALGTASAGGTGGMGPKIEAALSVARAGVPAIIACGATRSVITRALSGEPLGTLFLPAGGRLEERRRWIVTRRSTQGWIHVDAGAANALLAKGGSLLVAGIVSVSGDFALGDTVTVLDPAGKEIGVGVTRYDRKDLQRIRGQRSSFIAETLGTDRGPAIHRSDFVLMPFAQQASSS